MAKIPTKDTCKSESKCQWCIHPRTMHIAVIAPDQPDNIILICPIAIFQSRKVEG